MEEEKLTQLEIKVSYLEDFMNQIQNVCVEQTKEIEKLKKENIALKGKIQDLIENLDIDIPNRKPPHW